MSGSNCICVATVLLETGMIEMQEPYTTIRFDMPAGLVTARATCRDGKCERVELNMNASYLHAQEIPVKTQNHGEIIVDIAFGGIFYALIEVSQTGLEITPENARQLVSIGSEVQRALKEIVEVIHPENDQLRDIAYAMFIGRDREGVLNGATILPPGRIDRSPCGTGNSARMALMYERGEIKPGDSYLARSIIGSEFELSMLGSSKVGSFDAVLPCVSGRGWIHGIHQIGLDPSDPFPLGYHVSDCWGDATDLLL